MDSSGAALHPSLWKLALDGAPGGRLSGHTSDSLGHTSHSLDNAPLRAGDHLSSLLHACRPLCQAACVQPSGQLRCSLASNQYDWNVSCTHEEVPGFFKLGSSVFGVNAGHQGARYIGQGVNQAMSSDLPQPSASLQLLFSTSTLRAVRDLAGPSVEKTSSQDYAWRGCRVQYLR